VDKRWFDILAPPKARGRKRKARRWLDILTARCTNGIPRERRPGARYISFDESVRIRQSSLDELEVRDPLLYRAVREVMWDNLISDLGITREEWRLRATRHMRRIAKIRATLPLDVAT